MASTNRTGTDIDLNMTIIIKNIATIENILTFLKSLSAIVTRSLVSGASPPTNPSGSYFFTISLISSNCTATSLVADLYFELTIIPS